MFFQTIMLIKIQFSLITTLSAVLLPQFWSTPFICDFYKFQNQQYTFSIVATISLMLVMCEKGFSMNIKRYPPKGK